MLCISATYPVARCLSVRLLVTFVYSRHKIPRTTAYTIAEKAIWFRHPDYNPDGAQKLISSSMSRHLSTHNISSKSMHAFLSNLANRQTDKRTDRQTRTNAFTSSFVGGNNTGRRMTGTMERLKLHLTDYTAAVSFLKLIGFSFLVSIHSLMLGSLTTTVTAQNHVTRSHGSVTGVVRATPQVSGRRQPYRSHHIHTP